MEDTGGLMLKTLGDRDRAVSSESYVLRAVVGQECPTHIESLYLFPIMKFIVLG